MARQRQGGGFLRLLSFLGFVLSVLCAVYIGMQLFGGGQQKADIAKAIDAGEYAMFPLLPTVGYVQTDGKIYIDSTDADLKIAVIEVNNN